MRDNKISREYRIIFNEFSWKRESVFEIQNIPSRINSLDSLNYKYNGHQGKSESNLNLKQDWSVEYELRVQILQFFFLVFVAQLWFEETKKKQSWKVKRIQENN